MRLIRLVVYVLLAVIVSAILAIAAGRCHLSIVSRPKKFNKEVPPPWFVVIGFSSQTGKAELVKLYEYSALLKDAAVYGLDKNELLRQYGPIVFDEKDREYSYAVDRTKIDTIENEVNLDIKFPNIERIEIELPPVQEEHVAQRVYLHAESDEFEYDFFYDVANGHPTPVAYGDVTRRKIWRSLQLSSVVFLFSMGAFVFFGRFVGNKEKRVICS